MLVEIDAALTMVELAPEDELRFQPLPFDLHFVP